ncbi:MAG: MFS transporter [Proteobacteria bacterium]|jgi:predicted MFS family arabinose efflux permease|nr:MAG: MFS transporter [Pseudomonadota bacterium]
MDLRLLTLALGTFAIGTDSFVVAGLLPQVSRSLNVSIEAAGQMITVYAIAYAVMTPVMATFTAHWPRRRVLGSALAVFTLGNVLTAVVSSFDLVLLSRALAGVGGAMFTPAASATAAALVPPEARGRALAVVMAGLSGATALGAPIGTLVGSAGDWRATMWLVALLGLAAGAGIAAALPQLPGSTKLSLGERLAPLGDKRVAMILMTTLLVLGGLYTVYSYVSVVFDRATAGNGSVLALLIGIWGMAATIGNLVAGSLTDRFGSRAVINLAIAVVAIDFALIPLSSATFTGSVVALIVWGLCGWGMLVPQQHRLVSISPALAPILLALNAATIYIAVSLSGLLGAAALQVMQPYNLALVGAVLIIFGLGSAELAYMLMAQQQGVSRQSKVKKF